MERLLVHLCCGPCSLEVVERLRQRHAVTGFFYNPNIHPLREYEFRLQELQRLSALLGRETVYAEYDFPRWFEAVRGLEDEPERGLRCRVCIGLRLRRTFEHAREHGFSLVATSLAVSPYKSLPLIHSVGEELAAEFSIPFLAENFRRDQGYERTRERARALGVWFQNYCGCVYSRVDRLLHLRRRAPQAE